MTNNTYVIAGHSNNLFLAISNSSKASSNMVCKLLFSLVDRTTSFWKASLTFMPPTRSAPQFFFY
jgi:hypothetical protein